MGITYVWIPLNYENEKGNDKHLVKLFIDQDLLQFEVKCPIYPHLMQNISIFSFMN